MPDKQPFPMDYYTFRLQAWHARKLRKWGGGNASEGMRQTIEIRNELEAICEKKGACDACPFVQSIICFKRSWS